MPSTQVSPGLDVAEADREPERDEGCDLREPGERREEPLDLALSRRRGVAEQDPRDEGGEEARAADDGSEPVDDPGAREHANRVERRPGEPDVPHDGQE